MNDGGIIAISWADEGPSRRIANVPGEAVASKQTTPYRPGPTSSCQGALVFNLVP